jgi:hypothetical protein
MPEAGPRYPKPAKAPRTTKAPAGVSRARSAPPPSRGPNPAREEAARLRREQRIDAAATFCAKVVDDGWEQAVADRATEYVTAETWQKVFAPRGRRRRCTVLAKIAQAVLAGKKKLHSLVGSFAAWLADVVGLRDRAVQAFVRELASNIPLPIDAKIVAVARGTQVTGILLCVMQGDDLRTCQCFIDLALAETKTQVKKILVAAVQDWIGLAGFPAASTGTARF